MFSLQPCDELVFASPTTSHTPHHPIVDHSLLESNLISFSNTTKQLGRRSPTDRRRINQSNVRREIERRRRQEMSSLYASLGSLLPLDHNKGKSPVSDQIEEAENYIKEMHKKIQELKTRRDKMTKLDNSSSSRKNVEIQGGSDVLIHRIVDGLEIMMSKKSSTGLKLSLVISELMERELDVVSCVSTKTKGGFLLKFEVRAKDMKSLDLSALHDRLTDAIKY